MKFHIKHVTRYLYTAPVYCEPITIRLRPRCDVHQDLQWFRLSIDPEPAGQCEYLDLDGQVATRVWFADLTCWLAVSAQSQVETLTTNPFQYLLDQSACRLGFAYPAGVERPLQPFRQANCQEAAVAARARQLAGEVEQSTAAYLGRTCQWLHENIDYHVRHEGPAYDPAQTLQTGRGACRDSAELFIELCRQQGLAARFVSGYAQDDADGERYLHAWAEVYLPGAGWRGYDPTTGLAVADRHVAVATGLNAAATTPIAGHFRSEAAHSSMQVQIVLRTEATTARDDGGTDDSITEPVAAAGRRAPR